jgi:hypothetical protein
MTELTSLKENINLENNIQAESEIDSIEPFDPTKIRVDTRPMPIDLILKRIQYEEINLAPDFQRHANIWNKETQSKLIESILIRIPLPAFYIDATDEDKWLVIDGLQRLSTLKNFIVDKTLKLTKLEFLTDIEGLTYEKLPRGYQRRIDETILTIYAIEKGTPPEVKFNIFRRINTGGSSLSPQELRHALTKGKATKFLSKLANLSEFKRVTTLSNKKISRMDDCEFILGFIAFSLCPYQDYPAKKGRDYFLYTQMERIIDLDEAVKTDLEEKFLWAMNAAWKLFGDNAFRKPGVTSKGQKYPVNKALFECWSVILSKLSSEQINVLEQKKSILSEMFIEYVEKDLEFEKSISQAANKIKYRFRITEEIINKILS